VTQLTTVAVYRRKVASSVRRIWENVYDWEHLPWLHHTSFAAIELIEARPDGWHARVRPRAAADDAWLEIDLVTWKPQGRYVARTVAGPGTGTEIWTSLEPVSDQQTNIEVEFRVPGVTQEQADGLGKLYTRLYAQLWDEDEGMMVTRQTQLDAGAGRRRSAPRALPPVPLGDVAALRARLPRVIDAHGERWRIVDAEGGLAVHAAVCPHRFGPLEQGEIVDGCVVVCPWHGYRFDVRTCASADERGYRLPEPPTLRIEPETGEAWLQWSGP
jgi:nitrite reductase/ring-hydroxylating ferredoxin subunit